MQAPFLSQRNSFMCASLHKPHSTAAVNVSPFLLNLPLVQHDSVLLPPHPPLPSLYTAPSIATTSGPLENPSSPLTECILLNLTEKRIVRD
ncbi:unnamed protein product [Protopolystoma xenopodis]|uniref:Uncharacterized protein n=1 Tax=Protopolystoma xenopodis TaxID=117903 RepID=A0A3S5A1I5_9PLAT|nr:unnamed protein product [Protopolystoma xenopodis]